MPYTWIDITIISAIFIVLIYTSYMIYDRYSLTTIGPISISISIPKSKSNSSLLTERFEKAECDENDNDRNCIDTKDMNTENLNLNLNLLQDPINTNNARYMTTGEFNKIIVDMQTIITNMIIKEVENCKDMNGSDGLERKHMTFNCINNVSDIQNKILYKLSEYIIETVKSRHNITINIYAVYTDLMDNLDLLEDVIYPLLYSKHYTIHGINYFTKSMLIDKVVHNVKMNDAIYTTLQRRGIEVIPDIDDQI